MSDFEILSQEILSNANLFYVVADIRKAHANLMQTYKNVADKKSFVAPIDRMLEERRLHAEFKKELRGLCDVFRAIAKTEEGDGVILHLILNTPAEQATAQS